MIRLDRVKVICFLAQKNLMKKDIARLTGLNRNTISSICSGKSCSENTAQKIAAALGVTVDDLIETK